ncbi:MAG: hypothetical protein C0603_12255 [Denitrovibrio sp.]|nr:MAG: hypothetical protein C0603_12255 [Denitrovibrio sp.]
MNNPDIKSGLLMEDKISLMNRLSTFYKMSEFFFSLDRDIVRTANDNNINHVDLTLADRKERQYKMAAEKIKEICDRLKLLDSNSSDKDKIVQRKELLKRKLIKLTRSIDEIK